MINDQTNGQIKIISNDKPTSKENDAAYIYTPEEPRLSVGTQQEEGSP